MSLATRINHLRTRQGKSLQEVADAVGVSKTHIWELEKGRSTNPSVDLIKKLADHFGVTISALVGEDLHSSGDEQLERMFRQVGELDERDRALLDDMIRNMLKRRRGNED